MICNKCGINDSLISFIKIYEENIEEINLCINCIEKFIKKDFENEVEKKVMRTSEFIEKIISIIDNININKNKICKHCNTKLIDIMNTENIGCEYCYEIFEENLEEFYNISKFEIKENYEYKKSIMINEKIKNLKRDLKIAIALEKYEEAALINDNLNKIRDDI